IEPGGTIWAEFDPIIYHNGSIIYQEYPGDYYRIDVSQPENPTITGFMSGTNDVCLNIITYQDTLLITSMQRGGAFWDGNFRIMRNIPPDPLSSIGTYGFNSYSYTSAVLNIDNFLITSHNQGLRVYDLSDSGCAPQTYYYPTEWGRCLEQSNEFIFMGCNNGWHVFEYTSSGDIQHLEFYPNDTRVLRMRMKPEEEELWCFVDGGSLGGLVVLDLSGGTGIGESETGPVSGLLNIQSFPNPFSVETTISYSIPVDGHTTLRVYNLKGQLVRTLADDYMQSLQSGCYSVHWDGRDARNRSLPNSVYICHLVSGNSTATCRLMLVK
ncbi:MAG: T9SS type A sorting domain-containing protein, partial [Candidatus Aegiribacteria sp.]|nr:T9SS type A sorting domain-containing protein [Candidatus Aegiribacteria sp.]